jgi:hypothetical protein
VFIVARLTCAVLAGAGLVDAPSARAVDAADAADRPPSTAIEWRRATAAEFDPGFLISDEEFFDSSAMSAGQIQDFLEGRACRPTDGVDCLADYRETTSDVADVGFGHCAAYPGDAWESASVIISGVARACGINPRVLIVLLQKEQSLVTRPSARGYERATGYACPDTADCDADYFGFFNQVYNAAWQFRQYTLYPAGRQAVVGDVTIDFSPVTGCGSRIIDIRNQATANLYNYTPFQPNRAALADLYGDGDGCSAYGNRNFWRIYTDWFRDPTSDRLPEWLGACFADRLARACDGSFWVPSPAR